jgi:ABC-type branched-subunit amino acid transport system ATPase component
MALDYYSKLHHIQPNNPYVLEKLAYSYFGVGRNEEVPRVFSACEELERSNKFVNENSTSFREWVYSAFPELLQECINAGVNGSGGN